MDGPRGEHTLALHTHPCAVLKYFSILTNLVGTYVLAQGR